MPSQLPVLVSIPASNFVEKARWALQLAHVPFVEDKHVPIFHRFTTKPLGGSSVPLLSVPESKTVFRDSSAILDFCATSEPLLYPNEQTKQRELYYDTELGPATRIVAYFFAFKSSSVARKILIAAVSSRFERVLGTVLQPILRVLLFKFMSVDEAHVVLAIEKIEAMVREVNEQLGDGPVGTRFLSGDSFSAADISFCAHFGLLVAPPENIYLVPYWKQMAGHPLQPRIEALQRSKAADFVRWCYQHKRPPMV